MALIVEDGTGAPVANSYASESYLEAYAEDRGLTIGSGDPETALVRASAWIDARYGARFPGTRINGRDQGLAWPRTGAYDAGGYLIPSDAVPVEIKRATAEAALREIETPGVLIPDTAAGSTIRRKKLGSMEIEYAVGDGARPAAPRFPLIDGILAPLLGGFGSAAVLLVRA